MVKRQKFHPGIKHENSYFTNSLNVIADETILTICTEQGPKTHKTKLQDSSTSSWRFPHSSFSN